MTLNRAHLKIPIFGITYCRLERFADRRIVEREPIHC